MKRAADTHSPERVHDMCVLMDAYERLLPPRQRQVMRLKLEEDLSLGEISAALGISRQACEDAIRRGERTLGALEEKIGLVEKSRVRLAAVDWALEVLRGMSDKDWREKRDLVIGHLTADHPGGEIESGV